MTKRFAVGILLTLAALCLAPGDSQAFGRRKAATYCSPPVYYYCPPAPCPHPPIVHAGWDCVKNTTTHVLRVHITSGYGSWEAVLHPGHCAAFWFVKDGKTRLLSAFTLDNKPVDLISFMPIDQAGSPTPVCFPVIESLPAAAPAAVPERRRVESPGVAPPGGGQPF